MCMMASISYSQVSINENFDSGTPAGWTDDFSNTTDAACSGSSERVNAYASNAANNLTSPNLVAASNATDLTVSFDYQILDYPAGWQDPVEDATPAGWGSAELQYSTDDGTTWTTALTIDDTNHVVANTCATMMATIPAASLPNGSDVKLQIIQTWVAGDYYFYVDNFMATQVVSNPPACPANVTSTPDAGCGNFDVPLSWDAATGALGYRITVGTTTGGTDIENLTDLGNTLSYDIVAPTAGSTYYYTVVAYNGVGDSTGCEENTVATFATGCYCDSMPTSNDGAGISNLQVETTDFPSGGDINYEDFTGAPVDLGQGITANVQVTFATGYGYDTNIWIDLNDDFNFDNATELLYSGESLATNPTTLDASFTMPATATLGTHRMRIGTADTGQGTPNSCYTGSYGVTMDVDVNIIVISCNAPTGTATLVTDCDNAQFSVDVDITGLGDGTSQINDGTTTYSATALGIVTVGPYTDASSVTLILENGTDPTCDIALGTFTYTCPIAGQLCSTAIDITAIPYSTTDDTMNYGDDYGSADEPCSTSNYLGGDDVVYSFTPATDMSVNMTTSGTGTWTGLFVYEQCPFVTCVDSDTQSGGNPSIPEVNLIGGTTYYIVISTYPTPQSTAYTLNITENTCTAATVTIPADAIDNANCPATVDVNISIDDLGDATSLTINAEDDMGNPAGTGGTVTATGIFTITNIPVPQTSWTIKIAHSSDITCDLEIGPFFINCPPANDDLANAMPIVCGDVVTGDTSYATLDEDTAPDPTGGADTDGPNVWYSWTGTGDDVTLSTIAAGFTLDTDIIVFTGTSGALTAIAGGYDEGGAPLYQSEATFTSVLGTDYLIAVDGYGVGNLGTFQLTMTCVSPPPVNDECSGAIAVALGADTAFDNTGATDSGVATCYSGAVSDLWYSFDAPMSGDVTITVGAGTQFSLWAGACGSLAQVGTCDQVAHIGLASGTYYVSVTDDGGASTLRVDDTATLSTTDFDSSVGFTYYPNPVNNTLTLSAQKEISNVAVFNMLGQQVIRTAPNAVSNDVDMSNLQSGAYFVQVTIGQAVETVRVIKN